MRIYLVVGGDQLFHNRNMPLLDCNEERCTPILVLKIDDTVSINELVRDGLMPFVV